MKHIIYITAFFFFFLTNLAPVRQTIDLTKQFVTLQQVNAGTETAGQVGYAESNDLAPGMFFFLLLALGLIIIFILACLILMVLGMFIIFGLVTAGILAASTITELNTRSIAKDFKKSILLASVIGGILFFGTLFWWYNKIVHWCTIQTAIITGMIYGLLTGLVLGLLGCYILKRLTNYFKRKLNLR